MTVDFEAINDNIEVLLENIDQQTKEMLLTKHRRDLINLFTVYDDGSEERSAYRIVKELDMESLGKLLGSAAYLADQVEDTLPITVWEIFLESAINEEIFESECFYSFDVQESMLGIYPELCENEVIGEFLKSRKLTVAC